MSTLADKIKEFKGYTKVVIKNYKSSTGDVSNVVLDVATKYGEAKESDKILLGDYKDIGEVKSIRDVIDDTEYEDLWVEAYDALHKSMYKISTTPSKPKPETPINNGITQHDTNGNFYVSGFIVERELITEADKTNKKPRKKQKLTHFKEHFKADFLTEKFKRYSIIDADVEIDNEVLTITVK